MEELRQLFARLLVEEHRLPRALYRHATPEEALALRMTVKNHLDLTKNANERTLISVDSRVDVAGILHIRLGFAEDNYKLTLMSVVRSTEDQLQEIAGTKHLCLFL